MLYDMVVGGLERLLAVASLVVFAITIWIIYKTTRSKLLFFALFLAGRFAFAYCGLCYRDLKYYGENERIIAVLLDQKEYIQDTIETRDDAIAFIERHPECCSAKMVKIDSIDRFLLLFVFGDSEYEVRIEHYVKRSKIRNNYNFRDVWFFTNNCCKIGNRFTDNYYKPDGS